MSAALSAAGADESMAGARNDGPHASRQLRCVPCRVHEVERVAAKIRICNITESGNFALVFASPVTDYSSRELCVMASGH